MNRRFFLMGAVAAPLAAPAVAAAKPLASGGVVRAAGPYLVGERGAEMVIPSLPQDPRLDAYMDLIARSVNIPKSRLFGQSSPPSA